MKNKNTRLREGILAPKGFRASAVQCGIKENAPPRLDLALIVSDSPATGCAVFTENQVKAAPVLLSARHIESAEPRAVIVNSGNANACTGPEGMTHAKTMAHETASRLDLRTQEVLVCSTGIIGLSLPIDRIVNRLDDLVSGLKSSENSAAAARAIMTSDTKPKSSAIEYRDDSGAAIRIGAIAKGAGMINPRMATMLCFVTTDAAISKAELKSATRMAVDESFNRISVDGDMSTNDTVIVMANGQADNSPIAGPGGQRDLFRAALRLVMLELAKKIVSDGERVTKLVQIKVTGAKSNTDAEKAARSVANSQLVKCSWNGNDPNWGRIIHAVGYSGARIREDRIDIYFENLIACRSGQSAGAKLTSLISKVEKKEFTIHIDLNLGSGCYTMYTSDLSPEYVDFNRREYALPGE